MLCLTAAGPVLAGCYEQPDPKPGTWTPIPASKEADALVHGDFDAACIDRIIVYVQPKVVVPSYVEELKPCAMMVVVTGEPALREFVHSLSPDASSERDVPDVGGGVSAGVVRVVLKAGESLYLSYVLWEHDQHICTPRKPGWWEGLGHRRDAWRAWLMRYVYAPGSPGNRHHAGGGGKKEGP